MTFEWTNLIFSNTPTKLEQQTDFYKDRLACYWEDFHITVNNTVTFIIFSLSCVGSHLNKSWISFFDTRDQNLQRVTLNYDFVKRKMKYLYSPSTVSPKARVKRYRNCASPVVTPFKGIHEALCLTWNQIQIILHRCALL